MIEKREPQSALVVEAVRGAVVESRHRISAAMVNAEGHVLLAFGEIDRQPIYLRSSAKPFQALPLMESGVADQYGLELGQIAILCASHSGTDAHVERVRSLLALGDLDESHLQCGTHEPLDHATAHRLLRDGETLSPLRHNCSGKHTGMLLYAQAIQADLGTYLQSTHPVQREILKTFSEMIDVEPSQVGLGIDGCSAPNFAVPLKAAALGYSHLVDPSTLSERRARACQKIVQAMTSHPDMVAGPGRFDTALMQAVEGGLLSKGGAEGYQAVGIPSAVAPGGTAAGLTLKVHDGDGSQRAGSLAVLAILHSLGVLSDEQRSRVAAFDERPLYNFMQLEVGSLRLSDRSHDRLMEAYERI